MTEFAGPEQGAPVGALVGNDLQVREVPAGPVPYPQADQSRRAVAQLGDHQTGLFRVADEDAHLGTRDDDAHMEPSVGVRRDSRAARRLPAARLAASAMYRSDAICTVRRGYASPGLPCGS